jgi:predicted alpha/beta superfamily hydrolase
MPVRRLFLGSALAAAFTPSAGAAASPTVTDPLPKDPLSTVRGRKLEVRSLVSRQGLEYRLIISAPAGPPPAAGFPVIYVTDGNAHAPVLGEIARLAEGDVGPVLVVGIGYPTTGLYDAERRSYDLTPPGPLAKDLDRETSDFAGEKIGGADPFLDFIETELKPAAEATHRIDRTRQALFGHSLGGLFGVYALFRRPDAFSAYVAASPAIWFNRRAVLKAEPPFAAKAAAHKGLRVLVTVGENEGTMSPFAEWKLRRLAAADPASLGGGNPDEIIARITRGKVEADMRGNARALADRLAGYGLNAKYVEYPGEEHAASVVDAYNRGVRFVFGPGF